MGKSKRKRGDSTGPSITPLGGKAASAAETPIKAPAVVLEEPAAAAAAAPTPQSAPSVVKQRPSHTVHASQGLRQFTATGQAFQFSGNHAGYLKVQYLAQIANWASTTVPNLGAYFGQRLAAASEALSIPPPTPHSLCQRCETVLHVGENCSVRVTKAPKKWRKAKVKGGDAGVKNALVYNCHFCKFGNKKPGTAKGHVKTKLSESHALRQMKKLWSGENAALPKQTKSVGTSNAPAGTPSTALSKALASNKTPATAPPVGNLARISAIASPVGAAQSPLASSSASPNATAQATGGGKKRKRKGWSTLKDMTTAKAELPTPARLGFMSPNKKS
ncbi:hypothetical protein Mapa_017117 [Marchantia paleacea]|nr:hypothetical protein Mapa_017117 [Marchantia paleacea]